MAENYGLQDVSEGTTRRKRLGVWIFLGLIPIFALLGMTMAGIKVAADYNFSSSLGLPWFSLLGVPIYAPWSVFIWQGIDPAVLDRAQIVGLAFFVLPLLFVALCVLGPSPP